MTDPRLAILRVIKARKSRGAKPENILAYLRHLLTVWKVPNMTRFLHRLIAREQHTAASQQQPGQEAPASKITKGEIPT